MTAIRKTILQITYSQRITSITSDYCNHNDRFGFIIAKKKEGTWKDRKMDKKKDG